MVELSRIFIGWYFKYVRCELNPPTKAKSTSSNLVGLLALLFLVVVWCIPKSTPNWNPELAMHDYALIFSSSHYKRIEPELKKLWVEYKTPIFIITDFDENYSQHSKTIFSLLRKDRDSKVILILKNSDNYSLLAFRLSPSIRKYQPPNLYSYSLGSFTSIQETYIGLLSVIDNYQQQKESERKVKSDFSNAIPAILLICSLGIICGFLYLFCRWLYRRFLW